MSIPFMTTATIVHGVCTESSFQEYDEKKDGQKTGQKKQFRRVCVAAGNVVYEIANVRDNPQLQPAIKPGNAVLMSGRANKYEGSQTTNFTAQSIKVRTDDGQQVELLRESPEQASANVPDAAPPAARSFLPRKAA